MKFQTRFHILFVMIMAVNTTSKAMISPGLAFQLRLLNLSCGLENAPSLSFMQCASQCHLDINCLGFITGPKQAFQCQVVRNSFTLDSGCMSESKYFEIECSEVSLRIAVVHYFQQLTKCFPQYCRRLSQTNVNESSSTNATIYHSECQCSERPAVTDFTIIGGVKDAIYQSEIAKLFMSSTNHIINYNNINNDCINNANRGKAVAIKDPVKQDIISRFIQENGTPGSRFWIGVYKHEKAEGMVYDDGHPLGSFQPWASNPLPTCLRAYITFENSEQWACESDQNAQYRYICDQEPPPVLVVHV